MFAWTPELEALAPPFRGRGVRIEATKPIDGVKLFATAAKVTGYQRSDSLARMLTTATGGFSDEADALLIACDAKGGELGGLSDSAAEKVAFAGVDRWFQLYGAAGAVEIFSLLGAWRPGPHFADGRTRRLVAGRLRRWLAHAEDYAAALAYVTEHDGLPHGMPQWKPNAISPYNTGREVIAFLFPDHRPFFERAVAQLVDCDWTSLYLLGAVTSAADLAPLAERIGFVDWDQNALVVARSLGDAGLAPLVAYSATTNKVLGVARALTAYVSPEAAAALALYVGNNSAHPILREYFASHPKLAARAIGPLAQSKNKKIRDAAAKLLA